MSEATSTIRQSSIVIRRSILAVVSIGIIIAVVLTNTMGISPAAANEKRPNQRESRSPDEIRAGVLAHDVDNIWSRSREEGGVDFNIEIIFGRPNFNFLAGLVRPNLGVSVNNRGDTSKLYAGLLWEYEWTAGLFLDFGLGAAVHSGELDPDDDDKKGLGSRFLFRIPIELGYSLHRHHRLSIMFDHVSNANLASPNKGMDTLGLRYGYRF